MIDNLTTNRFVVLTPFQQPITYFRRDVVDGIAQDTYTSYFLAQARSRERNKKDVNINPEIVDATELIFEIWKPVMDAVEMPPPRRNDYVTDCAGNSWTVFTVLGEFHSNVFTLFCTKRV
jgi:hypothetical protein